jgi:predicted nucleic acid-binding protein
MIAFFDTNVLTYTVTKDPRKGRAREVLALGGVVSVQILNEFANVSRNKLRHGWKEIEETLEDFVEALDEVLTISFETHRAALAIARDHGVAFYDALIVASALEAGCDTLFTEDMQHGRMFQGLTIRNPFRQGSP